MAWPEPLRPWPHFGFNGLGFAPPLVLVFIILLEYRVDAIIHTLGAVQINISANARCNHSSHMQAVNCSAASCAFYSTLAEITAVEAEAFSQGLLQTS
jgi:hypothetical protein